MAKDENIRSLVDAASRCGPGSCVLGINYSGAHDSAVALVSAEGRILYAESLERRSRVKQDGRPPSQLLEGLDWSRIRAAAVSAPAALAVPLDTLSALHPWPLAEQRSALPSHAQGFYDFCASLPVPVRHVEHQDAHAHAAFWTSGFEDALVFTYDGGMFNSPWFGGLFSAGTNFGLAALDRFSASRYAKVTSLYTAVTALLGFTPNKHEGKITGLAAYGKADPRCVDVLLDLLINRTKDLERMMEWIDVYDRTDPPFMMVDQVLVRDLGSRLAVFSKETVAASVQDLTEQHVVDILTSAKTKGWANNNICLSGGLFANVKVNQRVREMGFSAVWVCPPMTDDGTAAGAALVVASDARDPRGFGRAVPDMFLGPSFDGDAISSALTKAGLSFEHLPDPAPVLAQALVDGLVIGIFQGRMEFGPRALGNRSILASAEHADINRILNARLRRTEFMPFAPMVLAEDADRCFIDLDPAIHSAEFMTITCQCTEEMARLCPAVVHVDGTARPQLIRPDRHPLIHRILSAYKNLSGRPAIVNTSFNIHEEPIVASPQDAIAGFLVAGLDLLYCEGGYLVRLGRNTEAQRAFLAAQIGVKSQREQRLERQGLRLAERLSRAEQSEISKEAIIHQLSSALESLRPESQLRPEGFQRSQAVSSQQVSDEQSQKQIGKPDAGSIGGDALGQDLDYQLAAAVMAIYPQPPIVVDIGAERGSFTDLALSHGAAEVHVFEPLPRHIESLRHRFASDARVVIHAQAVSASAGTAEFHIATDREGRELDYHHTLSSEVGDSTEVIRSQRTLTVETISLAVALDQHTLPSRIDFLKIDTDGHDLEVLRGLGECRPAVIMAEFWQDLPATSGHNPYRLADLVAWGREHGYAHQVVIRRRGALETIGIDEAWTSSGDWGNVLLFQPVAWSRFWLGHADSFGQQVFERIYRQISQLIVQREEKEAAIRDLSVQGQRRQAVIETLQSAAEDRLAAIQALTRTAEERLGLIQKLHEAAARSAVEQVSDSSQHRGLIADSDISEIETLRRELPIRLALINHLDHQLREANADRVAQAQVIGGLESARQSAERLAAEATEQASSAMAQLAARESEGAQAAVELEARARLLGHLDGQLKEANADRVAQAQAIGGLESARHSAERLAAEAAEQASSAMAQLAARESEGAQAAVELEARARLLGHLDGLLKEANADRVARGEVIGGLQARIGELERQTGELIASTGLLGESQRQAGMGAEALRAAKERLESLRLERISLQEQSAEMAAVADGARLRAEAAERECAARQVVIEELVRARDAFAAALAGRPRPWYAGIMARLRGKP